MRKPAHTQKAVFNNATHSWYLVPVETPIGGTLFTQITVPPNLIPGELVYYLNITQIGTITPQCVNYMKRFRLEAKREQELSILDQRADLFNEEIEAFTKLIAENRATIAEKLAGWLDDESKGKICGVIEHMTLIENVNAYEEMLAKLVKERDENAEKIEEWVNKIIP